MITCNNPRCEKHIICRFIRKKGKIIYPKNSEYFSFCIETKKATPAAKPKVA